MGVITFNGVTSESLGLSVETPPDYEIPEKEYTITHVSGRNGDILIPTGGFQNVDRSYEVSFGEEDGDFPTLANAIVEWLYPVSGYARLEDTYEPDYYRMAICKNALSITNILKQAGTATLTFNCKPQRYLTSGEDVTIIPISSEGYTGSQTITNPTDFDAYPLITFWKYDGEASFTVNGYEVVISEDLAAAVRVVMDCELEIAYLSGGTTDMSKYLTMSSGYPVLQSGSNLIEYTNMNYIFLTPRWWTI